MREPSFDRGEVAEAVSGDAPVDGLDSLADEELLRRYRDARGPEAFTEMIRRHRPMVLRTCLRLVGNVHDAEDAAQSVFLVLAQRPEVVQRSLAGCLHNLARAAVSELCRARRRRTEREQVAARLNSMFTRLLGRGRAMEHSELGEELDNALAQLADPLRQAVILRYLEGHSQKEAAAQAGCTQTTMGWRSMKGLQQLRTILGRRGVALPASALLAVLKSEAQAAAALGIGSAATGPATATAVGLAAILTRQVVAGNLLRKTALVLLLTTVVGVGVGVGAGMIGLSATRKESPPTPAPQSKGPPAPVVAPRLGLFHRSLDIGGPAREGSAQFAGDAYAIQGGGAHIFGKADQFRFVFRAWTGDGEIRARVASNPDQDARQVHAGVMFRERLTPDSHHVALLLSSIDWHVKYRTTDFPTSACDISRLDAPGKQWVRLVRRGNKFTSFVRADGAKDWKQVKELELVLAPSLYVGLAVTAHDDAHLAAATFDHVSVER